MILSEIRFPSRVLGMRVTMNVLLPEHLDGPFATLYLLHGLSDDHTGWMRWTRVESYAGRWPLAIVMPQAFRGFYTNNEAGPRYADYLIEDVIGTAERCLPICRDRSARCVGGLSMGGYGALRLGLARPDLFASIHSHSGAVMAGTWGQRKDGPMSTQEFQSIFGVDSRGTEHDLVTLAERLHADSTTRPTATVTTTTATPTTRATAEVPKILIDCGENDFLIGQNRAYRDELQRIGLPHTYREFPGVHNWDYWDLHIREAIEFHAEAMRLKPLG